MDAAVRTAIAARAVAIVPTGRISRNSVAGRRFQGGGTRMAPRVFQVSFSRGRRGNHRVGGVKGQGFHSCHGSLYELFDPEVAMVRGEERGIVPWRIPALACVRAHRVRVKALRGVRVKALRVRVQRVRISSHRVGGIADRVVHVS